MSHLLYLDELIKDYLSYRGFTTTLRSFDNDIKVDKDKGFRVDRITDQISNFIHMYDIYGLRDLWKHLDQRIFTYLPVSLQPCVKKLERSVLRLYVINTIQTNKPEKLVEFFDKLSPELFNQPEWRDWFVLPYLKNSEENATFSMYFTKQWQDTLFVSLQNFLSIIFQNLQLPMLARYLTESNKIAKLQEENELLKMRLLALTPSDAVSLDEIVEPHPIPPPLLMDDFYSIAQQTPSSDGQLKSLKTILFNLGGALPTAHSPHQQHPSKQQQSGGVSTQSRRAASQAPPEDRNRLRSSSLAPTSSRMNEHIPIKRISQGLSHLPRASTRSRGDAKDQAVASGISSPFILLGQELYSDHRAIVSHAVFNPSGSLVASADADGVVKIWTPSPSPKTECGVVMKGSFTSVEWLPRTEKLLLLATKSGFIRLYDYQERRTALDLGPEGCSPLKDSKIMHVKVTPTESNLMMSVAARGKSLDFQSNSLHLYDLKSQKMDRSFKMENSVVNTSVFNHNGGLLICGCSDGFIRILDIRTFEIVASWAAHMGEVFTVKLSSQEDRIFSMGSDSKIAVWSLAQTGSLILDGRLKDCPAGPFEVSVRADRATNEAPTTQSNKSVLIRPYGSLFSLHRDDAHLFTCSSAGPVVYKMKDSSVNQVMTLGGHKSSVLTLDWCSAHQCGLCVASSLDGTVSLSTLLPC